MDLNAETFNRESNCYSHYRPKYPRELYQFISSLSRSHGVVWDSACGNGQVAVDIVDFFSNVEASDIHENQITNAFPKKNIRYTIQKSESTDFPDNYFDVVCAAQALHWFKVTDFFIEAGRVLKNEGLFFCWGYAFFAISEEIDEIISHALLDIIESWWSDNNRLLHNHYKSIKFPFENIEVPKFEMIEYWNMDQLLRYLNTWSAVKLYTEKNNTGIIEILENELLKVWNPNDIKKIQMDYFVYGGRNRKD